MSNQEYAEFQYVVRHYWQRYGRKVMLAVPLLIVALSAITMFYSVEADSEGVVLRLGKYYETTSPGLHFKLPWFIDRAYTVPVLKVQSLEFGYRTLRAGRRTEYAPKTAADRELARILTGDLNLAQVEWVVQYQVKNANDFLFKIGGSRDPRENAQDLISDVSEAVMRGNIGDVSVDSVITTGREEIADQVKDEMQKMLDDYESGILVIAVKLQTASPPNPVEDAFDAVNRAKQGKERVVNDAKGQRNKMIPAARGKRDRAIAEAEGYALRVLMSATGQANAFVSRLREYEKAPEITKTRLYLEAMEEILGQVDEKVVIDESVKGMIPFLNLDEGERELPGARTAREGGVQ